jgi:hypothetical protein
LPEKAESTTPVDAPSETDIAPPRPPLRHPLNVDLVTVTLQRGEEATTAPPEPVEWHASTEHESIVT